MARSRSPKDDSPDLSMCTLPQLVDEIMRRMDTCVIVTSLSTSIQDPRNGRVTKCFWSGCAIEALGLLTEGQFRVYAEAMQTCARPVDGDGG